MKLSLHWLKDYVDPQVSTDQLVHKLTMAGLEVESVQRIHNDTVFDLEITPNRPDCLNIIGLSREISAIHGKALRLPKIKAIKEQKTKDVAIVIRDHKDCARYIGTVIKNVHIANAPTWMTQRLEALGVRPISNAVDITNFVLMEMGQPLHVFDFDKIEGKKIIVRRAQSGEKIITLDGVERTLDPSILVIADMKKPIAIAGIMGGMDTQVTAQTKNILLESAQFDMGVVRKASRILGLKSDASYRFERGVDLNNVLDGANRAAGLLLELTQGQISARLDCGQKQKIKATVIHISVAEIDALLGTKVSAAIIKKALTQLGLKVVAGKKNIFKITVPSFRNDLKQNVDIIEEVARIIGYDQLNVSFPHIQVLNVAPDQRSRNMRKKIANVLTANGYYEALTFSLICQKDLERCGQAHLEGVGVDNALSLEHNLMRPSMMPSLLKVAANNFNRGQKDVRFFEIGKCYALQEERWTLAMLAHGRRKEDWRHNDKAMIDFYDLKGTLEAALHSVNADIVLESGSYPGLDDLEAVRIQFKGKTLGALGKVSKAVLQHWGIKATNVYFAQIDLQSVFSLPQAARKYETITEFPGIGRDISVAIKKDVAYAAIENVCRRLGGDILHRLTLTEEYTGEKIDQGMRGLVIALQYQSHERTLREDEVSAVHHNIIEALIRDFKVTIR